MKLLAARLLARALPAVLALGLALNVAGSRDAVVDYFTHVVTSAVPAPAATPAK